jgi:hypothetical protein
VTQLANAVLLEVRYRQWLADHATGDTPGRRRKFARIYEWMRQ